MKQMKTKSFVVIATLVAFMGFAHAEEGKQKKKCKKPTPEQLEKYDQDKDGKLSKEEKAEMRKDKPAKEKKPKGEKRKKKAGN